MCKCETWVKEFPVISEEMEKHEVDIRYFVNTLAVTKSMLLSRRAIVELLDVNQEYFSKIHGVFKSDVTLRDPDFNDKLSSLLIFAPDLKYVSNDLKLLSIKRIVKLLVSEPFSDMLFNILDPDKFIQMINLMFPDVKASFVREFIETAVPILLNVHDLQYYNTFRNIIIPLVVNEYPEVISDVKIDDEELRYHTIVYDNRVDNIIVKNMKKSKAKHDAKIN